MSFISQHLFGRVWFYRFHRILSLSNSKESILVAIALTTGIPISYFNEKYWHEFIISEVNGTIYAKPKIYYKNELHKLPWLVTELIKRAYQSNNLPLDELIDTDIDWNTLIWDKFIKRYYPKGQLSDFNLNFRDYPQILYARQALIKNGHSNKVAKHLKSLFGFKLNKELEDFLSLEDLSQCHLLLTSIDLYCPDHLFVFKDKGFETNKDYSNFLAFDEYLTRCIKMHKSPHIRSIYFLMVLCHYNGLRPAFLKDLRWKDFVSVNEEDKTLKIHSEFEYRGKIIIIPYKYSRTVNLLCPISNKMKVGNSLDTDQPYLRMEIEKFNVNNPLVFISAKGGPLHLQSLKRDMQKTLKHLKFPFWNKISTFSFQRMWGRRILEMNGDHKPTIRELKAHLNLRSKKELFTFLDVLQTKSEVFSFKGTKREAYSDYVNYEMQFYVNRTKK